MMEPNIDMTSKANMTPEQKVSPKELFDAILRQWKWILLSLAGCIALAVLYIAWKPYTYTREAQVEIKEDGESGSTSALAMFADLGIGNATNNLYNEMAYFESPDLMGQVVERLGLQTDYYMRKGLRGTTLYGPNLPIKVTFETLSQSQGGVFKIKINEKDQIFLSHFKVKRKKVPFDSDKPIAFGQTVMTPLGKIKIEKTPFFGKDKEDDDDKGYSISVVRSSLHNAVKTWLAKLSVDELRKEASVVNLTVTDGSALRADDVLNTMIQVYNEDWILSKNEVALASSDFIDERLSSLSQELSEVDSDISDFKSEHQIPDLIASANINLTEEQNARAALLELNNQLQMTRFLKEYVEKDASSKPLPANIGINSLALSEQIKSYNELVLNRNSIVESSSENNPLVKSIDSQIESSKNAVLISLTNQIKMLSQEVANLNKERLTFEKNLASNPEQARYLLSVERQQKVKQELYLYLLQKKEENQLNQAFTPYNTRIIARPHGDPEPSSPKPVSILMIAFILGLAMPIGTIYVREVSNTKVRDKNDLKGLSIPFLGEIPKVNTKKFDDKDHMVVVSQGNRNVVNEAYRVVRTNLNFMLDGEEKCPVVMLTSFNPGSGKSFIAINLAMSLAIRGKKVLVIDGDMRRNSSSQFIGNPDKGLAQCLLGKVANVNEVIVKGKLQPNLDVLPGGKTPPNPTELLENGRLAPMIEQLRQEYDVIFIDCPPIQMIADGRIFSTVCTNTIFVMRAGLFERGLLSELENVYRSKEYNNMCLLLNGTESGGSYGGYGMGKSYYAQSE
ncbi:MAG: polysaccharide biosynthesis tyrosine autokinase [Muribaculaceae bacterium]|nr:polysaccharide biosynthesis tyrosine autokinase [Muribaculaceae bacterium]